MTDSGELVCASRVVLPEKEYMALKKPKSPDDGKQDEAKDKNKSEEDKAGKYDFDIDIQRFDLNLDFENLTPFDEETGCS